MSPSDKRMLTLAVTLVLAGLALALLSGCRGPDTFGVGAGLSRGDGGISGPLSPGGPPGPQGPSAGSWDTDQEAWNLGAWVTWDLSPRRVEVVNISKFPAPSWRAEVIVPCPTPPEAPSGPVSDPEPSPPPDTAAPVEQPPGELQAAVGGEEADGASVGVPEALGGAGLMVLLIQFWPQILFWTLKLVKGPPSEVAS